MIFIVSKISGVAVVPDFYESEDGKVFKLRNEDIIYIVENTRFAPIVDDHIENTRDDLYGVTTYMGDYTDAGLNFDAILIDTKTENKIMETIEKGEVPNLSCFLRPTSDAAITEAADTDGNKFYLADKWELKHISRVDAGRCSPENGCGIFNYELLLTKKELDGASMPDNEEPKITMCDIAAKIEGLELKLSEQATAYTELEEKYNSLKTADDQMELVLSETKKNLELSAKKDIAEARDAILKLDKDYPLTDDMTRESMELVLGVLRRNSEGQRARVPEGAQNNDDTPASIAADFKSQFMVSPRIRR